MKLVVGLGNPGSEYQHTRHNVGFWLVDAVARESQARWARESRCQGLVARVPSWRGVEDFWLLKPQTFMNLSGRSVQSLARFYHWSPEQILVIHDDLDLPPGALRLKQGGGAGGHNGVKDIALQLASPQFWRLRLGIGHPGERGEVTAYVLQPPRAEERGPIEDSVQRGLQALPQILCGETAAAMQTLHTKARDSIPIQGVSS